MINLTTVICHYICLGNSKSLSVVAKVCLWHIHFDETDVAMEISSFLEWNIPQMLLFWFEYMDYKVIACFKLFLAYLCKIMWFFNDFRQQFCHFFSLFLPPLWIFAAIMHFQIYWFCLFCIPQCVSFQISPQWHPYDKYNNSYIPLYMPW